MTKTNVTVRPLQEADLGEADRIMRVAFGTFVGLPDPGTFMGDAHQALLDRGYRAQLVGVTMHKPDESAYHDETAWVIDDWR